MPLYDAPHAHLRRGVENGIGEAPCPGVSGGPMTSRFAWLTPGTVAVLAAILLTGIAEQLWEPFFPKYLKERFFGSLGPALWAVGIYSCAKNLVEGIFYFAGGAVSQRLGIRASMLLFGLGPVAGYVLFLVGDSPALVIAGTVMILSWEPLSVPASLAVLGQQGRISGFVLASIQKRLPKMIGPLLGGFVVGALGWVEGPQALVAAALGAALLSLAAQAWLLEPGNPRPGVRGLRGLWRSARPRLKGLLLAEVFVRWGDWLVRDFVVLVCVDLRGQGSEVYGMLVGLQMTTALLLYLPAGALAERGRRRSLILWTFFFFAAFPAALALAQGTAALVAAFLVFGLREIGEPVRKAVVTILMPTGRTAEGVGAYWGARSFLFCPAPIAGAWIWTVWGVEVLLWTAAACGAMGLAVGVLVTRGLDREIEQERASRE